MKSSNVELVKMSEKGQLVVPQDIREISNLNPGERFVAFPLENGVLFKRIELPRVRVDFDSLSKEIEAQFKKKGMKQKDVRDAVKWARG